MIRTLSICVLDSNRASAATEFVHTFYSALQSARHTVSSFYATTVSSILFNGNAVADGASVQEIFVNQMPHATYEVQSYDCQIINANYATPGAEPPAAPGPSRRHGGGGAAAVAAKKMSLLVLVSGYVRFGEDKQTWDTAANRGFSETFVLIPNPESGQKGRGKRQFLIQSQNFRLVV